MKVIDFILIIGKLKTLKRTGWVRNKIPNPESVADHSFRVAILAMVLAPKLGVDREKSIKMALVHDIGEAEIGDIVTIKGNKTLNNVSFKIKKETKAIENIFSLIKGKKYIELFKEYKENKTKVAKFVKQLDKLERAIQAYEYEKKHKINLDEFFENAKTIIKDRFLLELLSKLEANRD